MSVLIYCVEQGIHPARWAEVEEQEQNAYLESTRTSVDRGGRSSIHSSSNFKPQEVERIARALVNACANDAVPLKLAGDFEKFPPGIRMRFTQIANESGHSGNVRKGLIRADRAAGGKILAHISQRDEVRDLKLQNGAYRIGFRRESLPAVMGAERAFAAFTLPKDYASWSPTRKKKYREQLARERRERNGF